MNPTETALVILLAGLGTAIALGFVEVAPAILHSSISQAFLLIMTLVLFAYSPVVGIAAIALFAILMFKRNVQKTTQYYDAATVRAYQDQRAQQPPSDGHMPPLLTQPREYTVGSAGSTGSTGSQYVAPAARYATQPMFYDDKEPFASPDAVGTYPLGEPRPSAHASQSFTAMYRPSEDMGDNTFVRGQGPNMDEKMYSYAY